MLGKPNTRIVPILVAVALCIGVFGSPSVVRADFVSPYLFFPEFSLPEPEETPTNVVYDGDVYSVVFELDDVNLGGYPYIAGPCYDNGGLSCDNFYSADYNMSLATSTFSGNLSGVSWTYPESPTLYVDYKVQICALDNPYCDGDALFTYFVVLDASPVASEFVEFNALSPTATNVLGVQQAIQNSSYLNTTLFAMFFAFLLFVISVICSIWLWKSLAR